VPAPTGAGCWRGPERATRGTRAKPADCGHALAHWDQTRPLLAPRSAADARGGASDGPAPAAGMRRSVPAPTGAGCWRGPERATRGTRAKPADCGHALAHWHGVPESALAHRRRPRRAVVELLNAAKTNAGAVDCGGRAVSTAARCPAGGGVTGARLASHAGAVSSGRRRHRRAGRVALARGVQGAAACPARRSCRAGARCPGGSGVSGAQVVSRWRAVSRGQRRVRRAGRVALARGVQGAAACPARRSCRAGARCPGGSGVSGAQVVSRWRAVSRGSGVSGAQVVSRWRAVSRGQRRVRRAGRVTPGHCQYIGANRAPAPRSRGSSRQSRALAGSALRWA